MIATRVEKLKFIVEEMHIAFPLATHAPDAFVARTLARHILISQSRSGRANTLHIL